MDKTVLIFRAVILGSLIALISLDWVKYTKQAPTRTLADAIKEAEERPHAEIKPNCKHRGDIDYWKARALDCLCEGKGLIIKKDVDFCTEAAGRAIRKSCHERS